LGSPDDGRSRATPHPRFVRAISRGPNPRRAPAVRPRPGQGRDRNANGLPGGAKLRSGRVGCRVRRARPIRDETPSGTRKRPARRLATPGNRRPGLPVLRALRGELRREVGAIGETGREHLGPAAPLGGRTRTRKEARGPRERVRLLGKGKLCRETPRGASGTKQGREASGRHGERRAPAGARDSPRAQPEPSRGARTPRTAPVGAWRPPPSPPRAQARDGATRGTRRRRARGSKNPKRGDFPSATRPLRPTQVDGAGPRPGQPRRDSALKRKRTPREALPGFHRRGSPVERGRPRGRSERRGGRGSSHQPATRTTPRTSEGDANLTRARPSAGDCARPPRTGREPLEGRDEMDRNAPSPVKR